MRLDYQYYWNHPLNTAGWIRPWVKFKAYHCYNLITVQKTRKQQFQTCQLGTCDCLPNNGVWWKHLPELARSFFPGSRSFVPLEIEVRGFRRCPLVACLLPNKSADKFSKHEAGATFHWMTNCRFLAYTCGLPRAWNSRDVYVCNIAKRSICDGCVSWNVL